MAVSATDAAHLLRRSGFGVMPAKLTELTKLRDRNAAVDNVTNMTKVPSGTIPVPAATSTDHWNDYIKVTNWWLDRMRTTPVPLAEKLTLFWHGHFVTALEKVFSMHHLAKQNQLFRANATGNFHTLAQAIAIDPAMLVYLDNWLNSKYGPQENFARELMELFTLGQGNYTQADVVSMAKAWSGHSIKEVSPHPYLYRKEWHDTTNKKLFDVAAKNWDGPAALTEIIKGSKATASARFITAELFSFFAYPVKPADAVVAPLADGFKKDWSILNLVKAIFKSSAFWSDTARRSLVRSPVEFFVASMQASGTTASQVMPVWWMENSGQMLFNAPNVSGWGQNQYWLSTSSAWARSGFANHVRWKATELGTLKSVLTATPKVAVQQALTQFGIVDPSPTTRAALEAYVTKARAEGDNWAVQPNLIMLMILSPDFQVA
jgi:uncharacterized protein (DUF1800 family)